MNLNNSVKNHPSAWRTNRVAPARIGEQLRLFSQYLMRELLQARFRREEEKQSS
jgi:hypothetical protein